MAKKRSDSLIQVLVSDVDVAMRRLGEHDSETNRRDTVRTIFAAVEGSLAIARDELLKHGRVFTPLTAAEIACLREESYSVTDRGVAKPQPRFVPIPQSIRMMERIVSRIDSRHSLDFAHPAWVSLRDSIGVRNRLTHPKERGDLTVSREECRAAYGGYCWVLAFVIEVLQVLKNAADIHIQSPQKKNQTTTDV